VSGAVFSPNTRAGLFLPKHLRWKDLIAASLILILPRPKKAERLISFSHNSDESFYCETKLSVEFKKTKSFGKNLQTNVSKKTQILSVFLKKFGQI